MENQKNKNNMLFAEFRLKRGICGNFNFFFVVVASTGPGKPLSGRLLWWALTRVGIKRKEKKKKEVK